MRIVNSTAHVSSSIFYNNSADGGGAIDVPMDSFLYISGHCNFYDNKAYGGDGGAIRCGGYLDITNSSFYNNYARTNGGAIYCETTEMNITSTTFFGDNAGRNGGAVFSTESKLTIRNTNFSSTFAPTGGSIAATQNASIDISSSYFHQNFASTKAGAVYLLQSFGSFSSCGFSSNTAPRNGALAFIGAKKIDISGCQFYGNNATAVDGAGGAVYFEQCDSNYLRTITNCLFDGNSGASAGTIHAFNTGNIVISSSIIRSSSFPSGGQGSVVFESSIFNVQHTDFINNKLTGAVSGKGTAQGVFLNCTFQGNEQAIAWDAGPISILSSRYHLLSLFNHFISNTNT